MRDAARTEMPITTLAVLLAPLRGLWEIACSPAKHNQRMRRIELLRGLSDAQLAARGLSRDEIVRHVYRTTSGR